MRTAAGGVATSPGCKEAYESMDGITPVEPKGVCSPWPGYPVATSARGFCFVGGIMPLNADGELISRWVDTGREDGSSPEGFSCVDPTVEAVGAQSWLVWHYLKQILESTGGSLDDILRERYYQKDKRYFPELEKARIVHQPASPAPSVGIGVPAGSPQGNAWIVLDAICIDRRHWPYEGYRELLRFPGELAPLPTYNTAVKAGPYIFSSGQIAIDTMRPGIPAITGYDDIPEEGRFLRAGRSHTDYHNGPIAAQSWFVYNRRRLLLERAGLVNQNTVDLNVYLADMRDFHTFCEIHHRFFPDTAPATTVTQFTEVGHKGTRIETQLIAYADRDNPARCIDESSECPGLRWRRSAAVIAGPLIFVAGQTGTHGDDSAFAVLADLPQGSRRDAAAIIRATGREEATVQSALILARIGRLLGQAEVSLSRIVKLDVYLQDYADFAAFDSVLDRYLGDYRPALTCIKIPRVSPIPGARICVSATAVAR